MNVRRQRALFIANTGAFSAFLAAGSWISIPFIPVPITLQTLFLFIAGGVMGRYAVAPVSLYLLMGAMHFPVFHSGSAGIGVFLGPTGGYLLGFLPAALISGLGFERDSWIVRCAGMALALAALYACGVAWLTYSSGLAVPVAVIIGILPFLPGDILKAAVAYAVNRRITRMREKRRRISAPAGVDEGI